MPVLHRKEERVTADLERLSRELYNEWSHPSETSAEPTIIEESGTHEARPRHLYVVWSVWAELSPLTRSRLILDAYERLRGQAAVNDVTLALGLTPEEAHRIGIEYTLSPV